MNHVRSFATERGLPSLEEAIVHPEFKGTILKEMSDKAREYHLTSLERIN
jgi:hypothetical protein